MVSLFHSVGDVVPKVVFIRICDVGGGGVAGVNPVLVEGGPDALSGGSGEGGDSWWVGREMAVVCLKAETGSEEATGVVV